VTLLVLCRPDASHQDLVDPQILGLMQPIKIKPFRILNGTALLGPHGLIVSAQTSKYFLQPDSVWIQVVPTVFLSEVKPPGARVKRHVSFSSAANGPGPRRFYFSNNFAQLRQLLFHRP